MSGTSEQKSVSTFKPKRGRKYRYVPRVGRRSVGKVYFIQVGEDGPIKIGRVGGNSSAQARLENLQTAHYLPLHLRRVINGAVYEPILHEHFKASCIRGEWFEATPELLAFIADPNIERILPAGFEFPDARRYGKRTPAEKRICDNCFEPLDWDEYTIDGVLCRLCRCKFEDFELEDAAYQEVPEAA